MSSCASPAYFGLPEVDDRCWATHKAQEKLGWVQKITAQEIVVGRDGVRGPEIWHRLKALRERAGIAVSLEG